MGFVFGWTRGYFLNEEAEELDITQKEQGCTACEHSPPLILIHIISQGT
jgi:hypothetical protein